MYDILRETFISIPDLAKREGVALSSAWRWVLTGIAGNKLQTAYRGGRRFTSLEAYGRFTAAINRAKGCTAVPSTRERQRSKRAAKKTLKRARILK
jgi:hypothetical protein